MENRRRLRELISSQEILVAPGVFDGLSLRMVESMDFRAAVISGAGISESNLAWEDVGLLGFDENLRSCRHLAAVSSIPLMADADTGYGNAINCYFVTQAFEQAGLSAIAIEDQTWPKRCGHLKGKEVIPAEEMVEKLHACLDARRDPNFVVKARCDAFATHGLAELIRRLNLYEDAGADVLFADALIREEDIITVVRNVSRPVKVNMGFGIRQRATTPLISANRLQEIGVAMVSYPRILSAAALQGMKSALSVLKQSVDDGRVIERPDLLVSMDELCNLMGLPQILEMETRYLTKEALESKYGKQERRE